MSARLFLCVRVGWETCACGAAAALLPSSGTAISSNIRPAQRSSLRTFSNLSRMASRGSSVSRHSAISLLLLSSAFVSYFLLVRILNFPFSLSFLFLFSMVTKWSISPSFSHSMGAPPPPALTSPRIAAKSAVFALPVGP